jgi:transposase
MRSIIRRDTGQSYEKFLTELAKKSGIETPSREDLARIDRNRKKKGSNQEWMSTTDPDARIARMKDGSTHMAHKAEHAVDLESGAVIAVALQAADQGDTTTIHETLSEAGQTVAALVEREAAQEPEAKPRVPVHGIKEIVADKGYHSGETVMALEQVGVRSYIPEPKRPQRNWEGKAEEQKAVYGNRRRVGGRHGKQLLKKRGELIERSFAHCYETGAMRRTHLRGRENILKRQLIHVCAFNLSLIMRGSLGSGTPRELRNRRERAVSVFVWLQIAFTTMPVLPPHPGSHQLRSLAKSNFPRYRRTWHSCRRNFGGCATGC